MGNTIQQPPQLIDSANIRQEDVYEAISDPGDDGGQQNFESPLESGFPYPAEDLPVITNGYPTGVGTYEQQAKFALYSQFPNGSANGYGAIRNYGDHGLLLGEGTVLRPPVVQEKPPSHISPPPHPHHHHHHQPHHPPHHHHHQQQQHQHHPHNPPLLPHHHHPPPASHLMPQVLPPPPPLLLPSSPPLLSPQESTVSNPIVQSTTTPKKTSSPEIKIKIIKTYQNGRELFESSLCGDLLQEFQAGEPSRRRHEQKKEKRKKRSSRHGAGQEEEHMFVALFTFLVHPRPSYVLLVFLLCCFKFVSNNFLAWFPIGVKEYHVQFFGSVPERAWIHEKRIVVYKGESQFEDLQAETLRKATNPTEKQKLLKPQSQKERAQWEVGVGHAEAALQMTREERNENYTFIYIDKEPSAAAAAPADDTVTSPRATSKNRPERKQRRSKGSAGAKEEPIPRRQQPRRQCSINSSGETSSPNQGEDDMDQEQPNSPAKPDPHPKEPSPPPVRTPWKTAAARKLLPLSITMKKLNISDSCKPLKKRSRASTDVEMASSLYRDTSDSDSRGLNDPQVRLSSKIQPENQQDFLIDTLASNLFVTSLSPGSHPCFSCKVVEGDVKRCSVNGCGRYYHETCARKYTGTTTDTRGLRCPQHSCGTCSISEQYLFFSCPYLGRMMRCIRCPVAYHTGDGCVAAGSVLITPHIIICSNHSSSRKNGHFSSPVNVGWCFICARGGRLLCCEACPASFHPECLNMEMPEGTWLCGDCRAGKKPHYKQIVWVKLGNYRWWPAEICNPRLVPSNIQTLKHDIGDFPVFFFGSHDYYWINQGRVFPYVESDKNFAEGQVGINKTFKKALEEAAKRFQELKAQRETKEALEQERNSRRPPPYKLIKSNKPVGKVQVHVADLSEIPRCNCKPTDERPCSQDSQCLNRMLQYECHPQVCPAGDRCHNQCFSKRLYPDTEVIKTTGRGWGLKTKQDLKKGDFVMEYVGELIDSEECKQRIRHANENHVTNFYMLTLTKDRVIDAGPKGNLSRFMNHSCSPNCETQKWTINGDVRIGLFTLCDIAADTELTFNYNLDCLGNGRTSCHCGSENCSGFLGVKPKSAVVMEREEKVRNAKLKPKKRKLKTESKQTHEYYCYSCGEGGELVMCDKKDCPKAYHLLCLNLTKPPYGRWECPWHQCSVCQRTAAAFCHFCPTSFCREHERGQLVVSALDNRTCCSNHDPQRPLGPQASPSQVAVKKEPLEAGEEGDGNEEEDDDDEGGEGE
uniref:Nuclear receptor binding SET domain protein 3 n=1 Tax=Cyprinus carpio TaxID=7962 RepID=A0A8C2HYG1_CYPCA